MLPNADEMKKICTDINIDRIFPLLTSVKKKHTHTHKKTCAHVGRKLIRKCSGLTQFPFYATKLKITANGKPKRIKNLNMISLAVYLFRTEHFTCFISTPTNAHT